MPFDALRTDFVDLFRRVLHAVQADLVKFTPAPLHSIISYLVQLAGRVLHSFRANLVKLTTAPLYTITSYLVEFTRGVLHTIVSAVVVAFYVRIAVDVCIE